MGKYYILISLSLILAAGVSGQVIYTDGRPDGFADTDLGDAWHDLQIGNYTIDSLLFQDVEKNQPFRFAAGKEVTLNPFNSGLLIEKEGGAKVWYLPVYSKGAASLNVIFSKFRLTEEESLFIYDPAMANVTGPLTSRNNSESGVLATIPVPGERLIIEYHLDINNQGILEVGKVSHDFRGVFGDLPAKDNFFGRSGPCNVDINCSSGDNWQIEKRSVVRIIVDGIILGTGVMLNNTNQENIPYLLTASHVIADQIDATASLFYFGYESPWCDGPDGRVKRTISGSELISSSSEMDFSLVKLSSFPQVLYRPYLAGWDATASAPSSSVAIHHPSGDVKKITVDANPPVIATYPQLLENGFWKVLMWEQGTTEGGSSGAPLINQAKRVAGILVGGEAICGRSENDYFVRMDKIYDYSSNIYQSLKPWLNPAGSSSRVLDGRDPYLPNYLTFDTIKNFVAGTDMLTPYTDPGRGYTTGFNSDSIVMYAESFNSAEERYITDVFLGIGKVNGVAPADSISIYILKGDAAPAYDIASSGALFTEMKDDLTIRVDFGEPVPVSGKFYVAYLLWYKTAAGLETRQCAIYHGPAIAEQDNTAWFMDKNGWHEFVDHPFDPGARNLFISVVLAGNTIVNSVEDNIIADKRFLLYPSPFYDHLNIGLRQPVSGTVDVSIYSIQGTELSRQKFENAFDNILLDNIDGLPAGIYFVTVRAEGRSDTFKVMRSRR